MTQSIPLRGRPPKPQPVDQRITATVTTQERVKADLEMRSIQTGTGGKPTVAELVRSRATASIDLIDWGTHAHRALQKIASYQQVASRLHTQLITARTEMRRAQRLSDEQGYLAAKALYDESRDEALALTQKPVRRTARLVTRLSYEDRELIAFRSNQLGITISDYVRLLVYGYNPGDSDWHMSEKARIAFYHNIIRLAQNGGFPIQEKRYACPRCREVLPDQFQD